MMYSGDEDYGDEITSGIFPDDEPIHDDGVFCCPDCERPNQFGELCAECEREREANHDPCNCSCCEAQRVKQEVG